jgi:ribosomal protein S21
MAKTMIEVKKNSNENNVSLIRRFTRRMQESRTIQKVKGDRYAKRSLSKLVMKNAALKRLTRQKERARLIKLGKLSENPKRR